VPGGSVTALLRNYGAFEEPLVKNFVRQILQGLDYLHERDIIHRDIKGANILVDNKGGIKISDFGISKKVDDSKCFHCIKTYGLLTIYYILQTS
jgi:mitogen-activated protein kinase kinase kinase